MHKFYLHSALQLHIVRHRAENVICNVVRQRKNANTKSSNGANLGFEEKLWQAADEMRGHMDPAEYKHVVLGLIFLKYISDLMATSSHQAGMSAPRISRMIPSLLMRR